MLALVLAIRTLSGAASLIVFQNGHISGALAELIRSTRSADQGSVDRQDHGRESGVSRHARAGPHARQAGAFARVRAHALLEGKCWHLGGNPNREVSDTFAPWNHRAGFQSAV